MKIKFSRNFVKLLSKINKKDKILIEVIKKQLKIFKENPKHHSLRLHKLSGKMRNYWSISVTKSLRMIYILLNDDEAYFIALGTHDEVYKK